MPDCPIAPPPDIAVPLPWDRPGNWTLFAVFLAALVVVAALSYRRSFPRAGASAVARSARCRAIGMWLFGVVCGVAAGFLPLLVVLPSSARLVAWREAQFWLYLHQSCSHDGLFATYDRVRHLLNDDLLAVAYGFLVVCVVAMVSSPALYRWLVRRVSLAARPPGNGRW